MKNLVDQGASYLSRVRQTLVENDNRVTLRNGYERAFGKLSFKQSPEFVGQQKGRRDSLITFDGEDGYPFANFLLFYLGYLLIDVCESKLAKLWEGTVSDIRLRNAAKGIFIIDLVENNNCLLYTSPSPRDS